MKLLKNATMGHAKSACYRCERQGECVDMDAFIEGEGTLAICRRCLNAAGKLLGWITDGAGYEATREVERLKVEVATLEDVVSGAEQLVRAVEVARDRLERRKPKPLTEALADA